MYKKLVIGLDQSYTRTGISIAIDGVLRKVTSTSYNGCKTKSDKRKHLHDIIHNILKINAQKASECVIICERIRTFSHGKQQGEEHSGSFISTNYIKSTGALVATIVDTAYDFGVKVYSVDTRAWKSKVVGTTKAIKGDKKLPTIKFIEKLGFDVSSINRKGEKVYNDDAADSGCIALYGFIPSKLQSLKLEE